MMIPHQKRDRTLFMGSRRPLALHVDLAGYQPPLGQIEDRRRVIGFAIFMQALTDGFPLAFVRPDGYTALAVGYCMREQEFFGYSLAPPYARFTASFDEMNRATLYGDVWAISLVGAPSGTPSASSPPAA